MRTLGKRLLCVEQVSPLDYSVVIDGLVAGIPHPGLEATAVWVAPGIDLLVCRMLRVVGVVRVLPVRRAGSSGTAL